MKVIIVMKQCSDIVAIYQDSDYNKSLPHPS